MSPERLRRLRALLDEALQAAPPDRAALVASVGEDDAALGAELARLVASAERDDGRFEPLVARGVARLPELRAGDRLGAWRLVRALGQGGMGDVWLAERADGAYSQQVAVKSPRAGLQGPLAVARFERERALLAALEHPGIARLVDGGTTDEARPWLAMEFVDGRPIDEHASRARLDVHARVALLREVARALAAAHQRLVVHRDLKPSNVLVRADGRAALVDFGIGGLLGEAGGAAGTGSSYLGTPRYASPEQRNGAPCTTASDVYSLARLARELFGAVDDDLDAVLERALAEDPAARTATAEAFGAELDRWLARRPVEARRASWLHRARLFAARDPLAAGASALSVVTVVAALAVTTVLWRAERDERLRAGRAEARATARLRDVRELVGALVTGVHDRIGALPGAVPVRSYLIETAERHLAALEAEEGAGDDLAREIAEVHLRLADVRGARSLGSVGDLEAARASVARALQRSAPRARELLVHDVAATRDRSDTTAESSAWVDLHLRALRLDADLARTSGALAEAAAGYDAVINGADAALSSADPQTAPRLARTRAVAFLQRARVELARSADPAAVAALEAACGELATLREREPSSREAARDLAFARAELGRARAQLGATHEALDAWRSASALLTELAEAQPHDAQLARDRVELEAELALTLAELGQAVPAATTIDAALTTARDLVRRDFGNVVAEHALQLVCIRGARIASLSGDDQLARARYAEAEQLGRAAAARARAAGRALDADVARALAECIAMGAELARRGGAIEGLEARFSEAEALLPTCEAAADRGDHLAGNVRTLIGVSLGQLALQRGAHAEAVELLSRRRPEVEAWARTHGALHWPLRHQGALEYGLGSAYEALAGAGGLPGTERAAHLAAAREAYARGLASAQRLANEGRLAGDEAAIVGYFEADVARVETALAPER